jgi:hypothetical protein
MIAQCLANGKTVLFVSQKTAALEIVQRRLKDIGLGEYCLEVHSAKAQKSAVLGQLKTAHCGGPIFLISSSSARRPRKLTELTVR